MTGDPVLSGPCPRPTKVVYLSKKAAKLALSRRKMKGRGLLHVYRCPCGRYHIGHQPIRRLGA